MDPSECGPILANGNPAVLAILAAFGLKDRDVRSLTILIAADKLVSIDVGMLVVEPELEKFAEVVNRYHLTTSEVVDRKAAELVERQAAELKEREEYARLKKQDLEDWLAYQQVTHLVERKVKPAFNVKDWIDRILGLKAKP